MIVYYSTSNHLNREENIGYGLILNLSFLYRIRDPDPVSGMTKNGQIRDPG
jgi:hypothetical protein